MLSDITAAAAGLSWVVNSLTVPPRVAECASFSNWATFSHGNRVLEWFSYAIASLLFGLAY